MVYRVPKGPASSPDWWVDVVSLRWLDRAWPARFDGTTDRLCQQLGALRATAQWYADAPQTWLGGPVCELLPLRARSLVAGVPLPRRRKRRRR